MARRDAKGGTETGSDAVNAGRSPVPAIAVTAAAFAVAVALITGLLLRWPLTSPVVAALRLLAWTLAAAYAIAPVLALGLTLTRKFRQENEVGCSRLIAAWGVGWAAVVLVGTVMLASGLYFETVWVALASAGNLALVGFLVVRRWQPLRELRAMAVSAWDRWRARGLIGWDLAILLCLASVALLASLPPDARDELVYHLALPQFWRFQHDWWVPVDNLHWLFPANAEVIWGYGMAVGGVHVPRLLTFAFGLATLALLADWLAEAGHDPWVTRVSVLFLVLAPMPLVLLGICNAEWPLLFFLLLGWRAGRLYLESPRVPVLVLAALAWGVCLGFKYTAFPVVAVLALEWLVALARRHGLRRALPAGAALVLAAALLAGGWLFRNWRATGDPLYLLGTTLLGAAAADPAPGVGRLLDYSRPPGLWSFAPWLYHATADPVIDHRLHLGWPLLLLGVVALGWRRIGDRPWLTVVGVSALMLLFSPAPRAYVPLMGLAWLFLPDTLRMVAPRPRLRRTVSALMVLLALTSLPWFYVVLTKYSPGSGDYLLGRISDAEFLRQSGVVTPVVTYVQTSTPPEARVWLWCGEQTFYLNRWARASSFLEKPLFLTWFERYGEEGFSQRLDQARVDFILVETANWQVPPRAVHTETRDWPVFPGLRPAIARWMAGNLREVARDGSYVLYRVTRPVGQ
jgi:hypothetical protein